MEQCFYRCLYKVMFLPGLETFISFYVHFFNHACVVRGELVHRDLSVSLLFCRGWNSVCVAMKGSSTD